MSGLETLMSVDSTSSEDVQLVEKAPIVSKKSDTTQNFLRSKKCLFIGIISVVFILILSIIIPLIIINSSNNNKNSANIKNLNILFITIDDFRPQISGNIWGHNETFTPNLELLSHDSISFSHTYCQQALCSPSRTSFLTGLRPDTTKVYSVGPYFRKVMVNNSGFNVTTLPQYFKNNGFWTVGTGKFFHEGTSSGGYPTGGQGGEDMPYSFDKYWFCDQSGNGTLKSVANQNFPNSDDLGCVQTRECTECMNVTGCLTSSRQFIKCASPCPDICYPDGIVASKIVQYLNEWKNNYENISKPFFIATGFKRPHIPWFTPDSYTLLYPNDSINIAEHIYPPNNMPIYAIYNGTVGINKVKQTKAHMKAHKYYNNITNTNYTINLLETSYHKFVISGYYSAISLVDKQLGKIINELKTLNLYENTIIVLMSDHGFHLGEQGQWFKFTNFEMGTRVPLMIKFPNLKTIGKSLKTDKIIELIDIFPTLVDLYNFDDKNNMLQQLQGKSLLPLMKHISKNGKNKKKNNYFFNEISFSQYPREDNIMGLSLRINNYRYNEYFKFNYGNNFTIGYPLFNESFGKELYIHNESTVNDFNSYENKNVAYNRNYEKIVDELHNLLVNSWGKDNNAINMSNFE